MKSDVTINNNEQGIEINIKIPKDKETTTQDVNVIVNNGGKTNE